MTEKSSDQSTGYRSQIRDEQKERTRRRILEALVRVSAKGATLVTVPAVAEEAGVSIPTVYRHFGDKEHLVNALAPMIAEMLDVDESSVPSDHSEVDDFIRHMFNRLDSADPILRAALASGAAPQARRISADQRASAIADLFSELEPSFGSADLDRFSKVMVILTCSDALRLWQDRFDVDADEAAEYVIWAMRAMVGGATRDTS